MVVSQKCTLLLYSVGEADAEPVRSKRHVGIIGRLARARRNGVESFQKASNTNACTCIHGRTRRDADTKQELAGKGREEEVQIFKCEQRMREKEDVRGSFFFLFLLLRPGGAIGAEPADRLRVSLHLLLLPERNLQEVGDSEAGS